MSFGRVSRWTANAAALAVAALVASGAVAQPVERNLPPAPTAPSTVIAPPPLPGSINDDKSLGANLSSIVILGPTAAVEASPAPGVDTSQVARLNHPAAVATLRPFLGRPISRKLISQIEAQIVLEYRRQGYPFVEVSTPEQEITEGALQIRVVEFRVGKITVAPASAQGSAPPAAAGTVRATDGHPIAGAVVTLDGNGPVQRSTSDRTGHFAFAGIKPGTYTISVNAPGYTALSGTSVAIAGGSEAALNIVLPLAQVSSLTQIGEVTSNGSRTVSTNAAPTIDIAARPYAQAGVTSVSSILTEQVSTTVYPILGGGLNAPAGGV